MLDSGTDGLNPAKQQSPSILPSLMRANYCVQVLLSLLDVIGVHCWWCCLLVFTPAVDAVFVVACCCVGFYKGACQMVHQGSLICLTVQWSGCIQPSIQTSLGSSDYLLLNLNLLEMQMYQRYSNDLHIHQAHACLLQQCCHDSLLLFI